MTDEPSNVADYLFQRPALLDTNLEVDESATSSMQPIPLVPYQHVEKNMFQRWVTSSAWWASSLAFLVVLVISAGELAFFDFVLDQQTPTIFPVDPFMLEWLGIALATALSLYVYASRRLSGHYIDQLEGIAEDCQVIAYEITTFISPGKLNDDVTNAFQYTGAYTLNRNVKRKVYQVMRDLNLLLRVYPMAIQLESGLQDQAFALRERILLALNLPQDLHNELLSYEKAGSMNSSGLRTPVVNQIFHMILLRLQLLMRLSTFDAEIIERRETPRDFFTPNMYYVIQQQISSIARRASALKCSQLGSNPVIKGLLCVCTFAYVLTVPLIVWKSYWWLTLAVAPLTQWTILAFFYAGFVMESQNKSYTNTGVDAKQIAVQAAETMDRTFDALYRLAGYEESSNKWTR